MPVALLLVDALSPVYVSRATLPVLWEFVRDGYAGPLQNLYAFRGIEATLFSGRTPAEHGVWAEYRPTPVQPGPAAGPLARLTGADKAGALERSARLAILAGDLLPSDRLRLDVRYVIDRAMRRGGTPAAGNLIPPALLGAFRRSIPAPIWAPDSLGAVPTLFDELHAEGGSFATILHPAVRDDPDIPARLAAHLRAGERPDLWFIKFNALDALGHRHGPSVAALGPGLARLDRQLAAAIAELQAAYGRRGIDVVIVSDHGMSAVARGVDVRPALAAAGRAGPGLRFFVDSTSLRAWGPPASLAALAEELERLPGLRLLDTAARRALGIPADPEATGELLASADEGCVLFPDFFRRERRASGMHGYALVRSDAGLPYLATGPDMAALLPGHPPYDHRSVWAAVRARLGLGRASPPAPAPAEAVLA